MLDFYADWCVACKELESITFKDPIVIKKLQGFTLLKADVTKNNDDDGPLEDDSWGEDEEVGEIGVQEPKPAGQVEAEAEEEYYDEEYEEDEEGIQDALDQYTNKQIHDQIQNRKSNMTGEDEDYFDDDFDDDFA